MRNSAAVYMRLMNDADACAMEIALVLLFRKHIHVHIIIENDIRVENRQSDAFEATNFEQSQDFPVHSGQMAAETR